VTETVRATSHLCLGAQLSGLAGSDGQSRGAGLPTSFSARDGESVSTSFGGVSAVIRVSSGRLSAVVCLGASLGWRSSAFAGCEVAVVVPRLGGSGRWTAMR